MKIKKLILLDPANNNNRYFWMEAQGDGTFTTKTGRTGANPYTSRYPMSVWDEMVQKKLSAGYEDHTDEVNENSVSSSFSPIKNEAVRKFWNDIMSYSRNVLKETYSVNFTEVSMVQLQKAQKIISNLKSETELSKARDLLCSLFSVIPRRMKQVEDYLPASMDQLPAILIQEQDLLDTMNAQFLTKDTDASDGQTILDALGLSIRPCTDKEIMSIRKHMTSESENLFKRAFRVHNKQTDDLFEANMKKCGMTAKDVHYYYHGTRNMNVYGITTLGHKTNPDAPVTGKMFGYGNYYATRAKKSINYTSLQTGHNWHNDVCEKGYLLVFKVAYKNPRHVSTHEHWMSQLTKESIKPYDALFAHKGSCLVNDEIIVYDEAQSTLQYIIELEGR